MQYFIILAIAGLVILAFWSVSRGGQKIQNGFQKALVLKPNELITEEWQIYITPQKVGGEGDLYRFFGKGGVFTLLKTNQARLVVRDATGQGFIFDQENWPTFSETSKKANLHLFTRVSEARVLTVHLPDATFEMEWHVPRELRVVYK